MLTSLLLLSFSVISIFTFSRNCSCNNVHTHYWHVGDHHDGCQHDRCFLVVQACCYFFVVLSSLMRLLSHVKLLLHWSWRYQPFPHAHGCRSGAAFPLAEALALAVTRIVPLVVCVVGSVPVRTVSGSCPHKGKDNHVVHAGATCRTKTHPQSTHQRICGMLQNQEVAVSFFDIFSFSRKLGLQASSPCQCSFRCDDDLEVQASRGQLPLTAGACWRLCTLRHGSHHQQKAKTKTTPTIEISPQLPDVAPVMPPVSIHRCAV